VFDIIPSISYCALLGSGTDSYKPVLGENDDRLVRTY
jgi:hypothetical protein